MNEEEKEFFFKMGFSFAVGLLMIGVYYFGEDIVLDPVMELINDLLWYGGVLFSSLSVVMCLSMAAIMLLSRRLKND